MSLQHTVGLLIVSSLLGSAFGPQAAYSQQEDELSYPPVLPSGEPMATDASRDFLRPPATLREDVAVAQTPPQVEFMFFPGQTYPGKPWSAWGDSLAAGGKYYASIGDHLAPAGNAFVYEYDPVRKALRQLVDVRKVLQLPAGHYSPGKIHGRLDLGSDGWLYFSTHRGSTKVTTDEYHYRGDWVLRHHPGRGETEIVAYGPVPKHCIPASTLDPRRLIFYGGTAPGSESDASGIQFFAYDVQAKQMLFSGPNGPARYMAWAASTGRIYYTQGAGNGPLMRYDPTSREPPVELPGESGIRAATEETPQGFIYTVSQGQDGGESLLYSLNTRTDEVRLLGPAAVGTQQYIASLDVDPSGRYLYYVPGAHGGSHEDGSAVVQYDVQTGRKKVIAFLHPFDEQHYGCTLRGTYSSAIDPSGEQLYITWNASRGSRAWDCCALTVIHLPSSERQP